MTVFKFRALIDTLRNTKLNRIEGYQTGLSYQTVDGY